MAFDAGMKTATLRFSSDRSHRKAGSWLGDATSWVALGMSYTLFDNYFLSFCLLRATFIF
jgi:hypothetical protein